MSDARIMKFQTAKAFYDFCVKHDACEEGLAEISGLTLDEWEIRHPNGKAGYNPDGGLTIADWWDKTERADWMLWLRDQDVWNFPVPSNAKWRAECVLIIDTEWLAWRASDAEWLAWRASNAKWDAECAPIIDAEWLPWRPRNAKWDAELADLIRRLLGNPFRKEQP